MNRLLLLDDDPLLRRDLSAGLRARGYHVDTVEDAQAARTGLAELGPFDLLLFDITLPGESGLDLVEALRAEGDTTPIVFLTAHHTTEERVHGLRLGADDYIVKPFEFEELLARIEAVLRRRRPPVVYAVGDVRVDLDARRASLEGVDLELSTREFDLLAALIEVEGRVLSKQELLERVWEIRGATHTNAVEVAVMRLRKKLDRRGGHSVQTVVGEGYRVRAERVHG